ncbi:tail completion protein gp17 [Acinetobacter puyangensis]|uniref:tail completion protein gp17 n=1 Tax=Acinetobacter puyangensis TaxID=1096779 RepID=UPI003A4D4B8B
MSFLPIYRKLKASLVADIINIETQVFEDMAPLDTQAPYLVWQALGGNAINNLDCPASVDHLMYQVMVYDTDVKRAYQIRDIARKALEDDSYILDPHINDYDTKAKLYMRGFDAHWFLNR